MITSPRGRREVGPDDRVATDLVTRFGRTVRNRHIMKGNFIWDLPDIKSEKTASA